MVLSTKAYSQTGIAASSLLPETDTETCAEFWILPEKTVQKPDFFSVAIAEEPAFQDLFAGEGGTLQWLSNQNFERIRP